VRGAYPSINELINNLKRNANFSQYAALTCTDETSTILVTSYRQFYFKFFIQLLIRLEPDPEIAKTKFVAECRSYYSAYPSIITFLEDFEEYYLQTNVVFLYTTNNFLFHFINQALRNTNIRAILLCHFLIVDLFKELQNIYAQSIDIHDNPQSCCYYRGQRMSVDELEEMKLATGELILVKSFFSATTDLSVAETFAGFHGAKEKDRQLCILFKITVDSSVKHSTFAEVAARSSFKLEREVLFTVGSIFSVEDITYDMNKKVWVIRISLINENDQRLQDKCDYENWSTRSLALQISQVGQLIRNNRCHGIRESNFYYNHLLKELSLNNLCRSICYSDLGWNAYIQGDFTLALSSQQKALKICNTLEKNDEQNEIRSVIFNSLGVIHHSMHHYKQHSTITRSDRSEYDDKA
ncbi:unnamed protein product, partial [Rotaria socialis]